MKEENLQWQFVKVDYGERFSAYDGYFHYQEIYESICDLLNITVVKYILNNTMIICNKKAFTQADLDEFQLKLNKRLLDDFKQKIELVEFDPGTMEFDEGLSFDILPPNSEVLARHNLSITITSIETIHLQTAQPVSKFDLLNLIEEYKEEIVQTFTSALDEVKVDTFVRSEILFSFVVDTVDEEELIRSLQGYDDLKISQVAEENELLSDVDYHPKRYSEDLLFHNIRKKNIIIGEVPSTDIGIFFAGYLMLGSRMEVTLKAFEYSIMENLLDYLGKTMKISEMKGNLRWEKLFSRIVGRGYQLADEPIVNNDLMKMFLSLSKNEYYVEEMSFLLTRLLGKGYLTKDEFTSKTFIKPNGKSESIMESGLAKIFAEYFQFCSNPTRTTFWVNPSTGVFYEFLCGETHKKIKEVKSEKIYAPKTAHLLSYIRAFWHQEYVHDLLQTVQKNWTERGFDLQILQIEKDLQCDFINHKAEKSTRDIDFLLKICDTNSKKEYILGVEAKRDTRYYPEEVKGIPSKMGLTYATIFDGFICVGYFDNLSKKNAYKDPNQQKLQWEMDSPSNGIGILEKPFLLCSGFSFKQLITDIEDAIIQICQ